MQMGQYIFLGTTYKSCTSRGRFTRRRPHIIQMKNDNLEAHLKCRRSACAASWSQPQPWSQSWCCWCLEHPALWSLGCEGGVMYFDKGLVASSRVNRLLSRDVPLLEAPVVRHPWSHWHDNNTSFNKGFSQYRVQIFHHTWRCFLVLIRHLTLLARFTTLHLKLF